MIDNLKNIIESILFVSKEPVSAEKIKSVVQYADIKDIRAVLKELEEDYAAQKRGFFLHEVAGGYQFRTRGEYTEWIKRFLKPGQSRLSMAALETLSIIAYKQPLIRSDIEHLRGVDCGGILRMLLERKLIRILGRKEIPGRPLVYATTKQFLEVFDLKELKDLPTLKEIETFTKASNMPQPDSTSLNKDEKSKVQKENNS